MTKRTLLVVAALTLSFGITACSSSTKTETAAADAKADAKAATADAKKSVEDKTKSAVTSAEKVLCETQNDKRLVEVRTKDKGCELAYTKFGKEEIIANSAAGSAHCQKISERIQKNLADAGFKCAAN